MRVGAIKRNRVEGGTEPCSGLAFGKHVKTQVGLFSDSFPGKHTGRVFLFSFEWEDPCRKGKLAGKILQPEPFSDLSKILKPWNCNFGDHQSTEAFYPVFHFNGFLSDLVLKGFLQVEFALS